MTSLGDYKYLYDPRERTSKLDTCRYIIRELLLGQDQPVFKSYIYDCVLYNCRSNGITKMNIAYALNKMVDTGEVKMYYPESYMFNDIAKGKSKIMYDLCTQFREYIYRYCIRANSLFSLTKEQRARYIKLLDATDDLVADLNKCLPVLKQLAFEEEQEAQGIKVDKVSETTQVDTLSEEERALKEENTLQLAEAARLAQLASLYKNKNTAGLTDKADTPA